MVKIHREGAAYRLAVDHLANELKLDGFVAFTSTRTRQRAVASAIEQLVTASIDTVGLETDSPNECMCVIDVGRYSSREVLTLVAAADEEYEHRRFASD